MIDFSKKLEEKPSPSPTDPEDIYEGLDRDSDKGPLRPSQKEVLGKWYSSRHNDRDAIVKLHTGQGKTLVGLLMLLSRLNSGSGPALYLCPNKFLVSQTCKQASQFGVPYCTEDKAGNLPVDFLESNAIFITSVQKLFNGKTKFGVGPDYVDVGSIVMDDAHACIDSIRDATKIRAESGNGVYEDIVSLFSESLESQGVGTFADIENGSQSSYLKVPYWDWIDKNKDVVSILSKYYDRNKSEVLFEWPILKDKLKYCECVVSGSHLEIEPYVTPLEKFGSYYNADYRVFMSARIAEDSFLVKGLQISEKSIKNPITQEGKDWSGEKMIVIPPLIDGRLNRQNIVKAFGEPDDEREFGVAALTPSFSRTDDWEEYGARVSKTDTIEEDVRQLQNGAYEKAVVFANRYDGIDLPDDACRVLILDSVPYAQNLIDKYEEDCRQASEIVLARTVRKIEQGLGRSVRGEKDYCVILLIGSGLVRAVRLEETRQHLSAQTRAQIEIGLDIAEMAAEETDEGSPANDVLADLITQCLDRDEDWKAFYNEQMSHVESSSDDSEVLNTIQKELEAEQLYQNGDIEGARDTIQEIIDSRVNSEREKEWYLQTMARYVKNKSKEKSNKIQKSAHSSNRFLLAPKYGLDIEKLKINQSRTALIIEWVKGFEEFEKLKLEVEDILSNISFGVTSDKFESALDDIANVLGFESERPDEEWKEGPDNLWAISNEKCVFFECKSEVNKNRQFINDSEAEQMNRSSSWIDKRYENYSVQRVIVHPSKKLGDKAYFTHEVKVMRRSELISLKDRIREFINEMSSYKLDTISEDVIQKLLDKNNLDNENIVSNFAVSVIG